jgi:hypothetical protein
VVLTQEISSARAPQTPQQRAKANPASSLIGNLSGAQLRSRALIPQWAFEGKCDGRTAARFWYSPQTGSLLGFGEVAQFPYRGFFAPRAKESSSIFFLNFVRDKCARRELFF